MKTRHIYSPIDYTFASLPLSSPQTLMEPSSKMIPENTPNTSGGKLESDDNPNDPLLSDDEEIDVWVSASDEDDDMGGEIWTIWSSARCMVSIESASLQIHKENSGCQIFGKITVDGRGVRYYIYNRSEEKADTIVGKDYEDLTLCGPKYALNSDDTFSIYVNLFEKSEKGIEPLIVDELFFHHPQHYWDVNNVPIKMVLTGDLASLKVWFTRIAPSVTTNLSLTVINGGGGEMVVSGHVNAKQTIPGSSDKIERSVALFDSISGVKLHCGESVIPLDRSVVVAPVQLEDDKEKDWGWLTIEFQLEIKLEDGQKTYELARSEKFELKGRDPISMKHDRIIHSHKRKLSSLCDEVDDNYLAVQMVVAPFDDLFYDNLEGDSS